MDLSEFLMDLYEFARVKNVDIYLMTNCSVLHPGIRIQMSDAKYKVVRVISIIDIGFAKGSAGNIITLLNQMESELKRLNLEEENYKF